MIDHLADRSFPHRPQVDSCSGGCAEPGSIAAPLATAKNESAEEMTNDIEETSLLTRALSVLAEHMMSHVRAQISQAPGHDRIFSDKSMPA